MADSTIPNLPVFSGTPNGTEPMETVQGGVSVQIPSQKVADLATIVLPVTKAALISLGGLGQISAYKLYLITDATAGRLLVKGLTTSTIEDGVLNMTTGASGTYVLGTDTFTSTTGNASITPITVAALTSLQGFGIINTETIYLITDASPFVLAAQFKGVSQDVTTATIMDNTYAGTLLYTASTGNIAGVRISDENGDVWNDSLPSLWTLGTAVTNNIFNANSSGTLGNGSRQNIFEADSEGVFGIDAVRNTLKQGANGFIFGNNLKNVTVEQFTAGADYTASPDYDFLYNKDYPATIFTGEDGTTVYHRYYDITNDRIVVTLMASPFTVSYIGGGGGSGTVNSGTQYRLGYYATTGTAISEAAAITAARALKSDANGVPTHFDTATEPSLTELSYVKGVTSAIQTQLDAKASKTFVESISLQDGGTSIAATTYTIELYANYAYTINELKIISGAGTCTASLNINGTPVTSISAVAVSTTIATATSSGANTVAVGDKITLVTTSNSGLSNLQLTIKTTRI